MMASGDFNIDLSEKMTNYFRIYSLGEIGRSIPHLSLLVFGLECVISLTPTPTRAKVGGSPIRERIFCAHAVELV